MSVESIITENLDVWTSAVKTKSASGRGSSNKLELYGIKKLRELILELAIRGKLVAQNPNDEPARELLKKTVAQKEVLLSQGKIKKSRKLGKTKNGEVPFELPIGWEWVLIDQLGHDLGQEKPNSTFSYIDVGCIDKANGVIKEPGVLNAEDAPSRARKLVKRGCILYSTVRPYLLNIAVVEEDIFPKPIASTAFAVIQPFDGINSSYIYRYLRSPTFVSYVESVQTGVAYPAINDKQFYSGLFPLPPQEEQDRIVAKVDELMALCDQLESQTEASIEAHQTLVKSLLETLTNAKDADELNESWQRISAHFDVLFTTEDSIDQLKQIILQLAVMGKLVKQDPSDEPASKLLERIAVEKEQLIKEKKIKKQKPLPVISYEEKLFALPFNWSFCRLSDLEVFSGAGWSPQCLPAKREGESWGVLKVSAVTWDEYKPEENKELPKGIRPRPELEVKPNDFLISRANTADLVAKAVVVPEFAPKKLMMSDKIVRFKFHESVSANYLNLVNNCMFSRNYYNTVAGGTSGSMKNVSREQIRSLIVPLPPQNEQRKILNKVEEIMAVCENMKAELVKINALQFNLASSVANVLN